VSARDTLLEIVRQWTERNGGAPEAPEAVVDASEAELLREWAARVRQVDAAKGWSVWAAAFMDPDVPFVDTGMPSTETIVAELRRLDRAAVLREVDEQFAAMKLPEHLKGTLNAGSYADAWRTCRAIVKAMAGQAERGKDTSGGHQPTEGESTPDSVLPVAHPDATARATSRATKPEGTSQ
jgi:hypothetical protein